MEEMFNQLKTKLYTLVQHCQSLKEANRQLRLATYQLNREKEILQAKHKDAISQIENMVSRLKLLEKPQ